MSEKEKVHSTDAESAAIDIAKGFWANNSKKIVYAVAAILVLAGSVWGYDYFIATPKEQKAQEEIFRAEANFRKDSLALALNGNATSAGFLKIITKYKGTATANLAQLYAGECFLQLGDFKNATKHLEAFDANDAKQIEAKAEGLLGDAYSELKENDKAISHYKKAGQLFPEDAFLSSEYLFRAGLLLELSGKTKEAISVYKELKEKFPRTEKGFSIDKYLARLGETN
jgi:tetratricopeptide (TPR) repeat protein